MTAAPGSAGVPTLRAPRPNEAAALQSVWEQSHNLDDPGGRPRGGWSVSGWPTQRAALAINDQIIGVAAIRAEPGPAEAVAARIALVPEARQPDLADMLVEGSLDLARAAGGPIVRMFVASGAEWALDALRRSGFQSVRSIFHMLLPADTRLSRVREVPGITLRVMRRGEEPRVLEALNRAWVGTWDFVPIRPEMLRDDLDGQYDGMLLGLDAADDSRIVATCHAVFDPTDRNPDGNPRAWISNLTVDPDWRGRGIARAMLSAGLASLRDRGAASVTLGVDSGDPAPLRLYQSAGFVKASSVEAWDKSLIMKT